MNTHIKNIGHSSFYVKDMDKMLDFYVGILGMKRRFTLTFGDLYEQAVIDVKNGKTAFGGEEMLEGLKAMKDEKWIEYLTFADHQYMELFYKSTAEKNLPGDRSEYYGYQKLNFEVTDVRALRDYLVDKGVELAQDIHPTLDGATEIALFDPEDNQVQFTQYSAETLRNLGAEPIVLAGAGPERSENGAPRLYFTTQMAYQVQNDEAMFNYYTEGLGLRCAFSLKWGALAAVMEKMSAPEEQVKALKAHADESWIDYIEVAPHQYIELFHTMGRELKECRDLQPYFGYQHICMEVDDIQAVWDEVTARGLVPDTPISFGCDHAWQFWLVDPDGNRMEMMQYAENARQLIG